MTRLFSRLSLTLAALVLTATTAYASSITYTVSRTVGVGSVTGTIVTDGTLGALTGSNITNWNLVINDGTGAFNLLGPASGNNSQVIAFGGNLTGTSSGLFFNYSGLGLLFFGNPISGPPANYWCLDDASGQCSGHVSSDFVKTSGSGVAGGREGNQQIGSVVTTTPVPEPATWTLIATGLAAFAGRRLARRR